MFKKAFSLFIVVLAGETIFMHPFLVPRLYRSLMMEVWDVNNLDIGMAFSAYGITAMLSYILGGPFADKFEPRGLMVVSLLLTVLGSLVLLFSPSSTTLLLAYGFFGVSTIFFMWSALIKVTHEIGGEKTRATAMGLLEGGRGFVAALMSSFLVFIVGTQSSNTGIIINKANALCSIYLTISIFMVLVCGLVWFGLKNIETRDAKTHDWSFSRALDAAKDIKLWMLAVIILCAYCSYKNVGNYSVYMTDVKGMSILESSKFTSYVVWARPISAIAAGILADRLTIHIKGGRFITLIICFILGSISQFLLALDTFQSFNMILSAIVLGSCFAFALRSIYFSVFGDFKINDNLIGTAVGIVSLVGYLPDFFYGSLTGYLIDRFPGQPGFTYVFSINGLLLITGALASFLCYKASYKKNTPSTQ